MRRSAVLRGGAPVARLLHVHRGGCQVQHHRCLDLAAMDAEAVLLRAEQALHRIGQRQAEPACAVSEQPVALAQLARHDVHGRHVAAVAVEQQQLLHPGARHAGTQFAPQCDQRRRRERERAGVGQVLGAQPDGLQRQKKHRQVGLQLRQRGGNHTLQQRGIDRQRQVRPVLLDRRHGQHRHGARRQARGLRGGEIAGGNIGPMARGPGIQRRCRHGGMVAAELRPLAPLSRPLAARGTAAQSKAHCALIRP